MATAHRADVSVPTVWMELAAEERELPDLEHGEPTLSEIMQEETCSYVVQRHLSWKSSLASLATACAVFAVWLYMVR